MNNSTYKRQYRELSDETKKRISASSKGKSKSETHKQHISQALKDYWRNVPSKPQGEHITMDEYLGIANNQDVKPSNSDGNM